MGNFKEVGRGGVGRTLSLREDIRFRYAGAPWCGFFAESVTSSGGISLNIEEGDWCVVRGWGVYFFLRG